VNSSIFNVFRDGHAIDDSVGSNGIDVDFFGIDNELADYYWVVFGRPDSFSSILHKEIDT
jgi:hypothetical protein